MQDTNITTADYFDAMRTTETFLPSLRSLDISLLPAAVQAIARPIGPPASLQLVEQFGGLTLYLPVGAREAGRQMLADLARRIGPEAARILARHYAVTPLYVPNCKLFLLRARDAALLKDRQQLARQGLTERRIVQCLALRYHITERHVWTIFKKPPPTDPAIQPQQGRLL